jgi:hypothetical protein
MTGLAVLLALGLYFASMALGGCARPVAGLWPPGPGQRRHKITVATMAMHSEVGVWPEDDPEGSRPEDVTLWGFGDRQYFLEDDTDTGTTLRALFLPSEGVVRQVPGRRVREARAVADREWTFYVTDEGRRRLVAYLEAQKADRTVSTRDGCRWYPAEDSYHALNHCHCWTARALRAAGLPIWPSHAVFKWSFHRQLDRAARIADTSPPKDQEQDGKAENGVRSCF